MEAQVNTKCHTMTYTVQIVSYAILDNFILEQRVIHPNLVKEGVYAFQKLFTKSPSCL